MTSLIDYKYNKRTYLTTDFQRVNEFDMFYYKTLSTFFEGSNVKIESTWQHQNVISPNMDIVINNDTKMLKLIKEYLRKININLII